jgi:hypothetical protein
MTLEGAEMKMLKTITKWMTGAALAGALLFAAPQKAEAQRVGFGISIGTGPAFGGGYYGGPRYVRPYPAYGYGYPVGYGYGYPAYYGGYGRPYYGGGYRGGYYNRGGYGGGGYRGGYGGGYRGGRR